MEEEEFDNTEEQNETLKHSVSRFEEMIRNKDHYFFDVDALLKIIDYYLDKNERNRALAVVKHANTLHPQSVNLLLKQAHLFALCDREKQALETLDHVEKLQPFDPDIFIIRGNIYNNLQEFDKAITNYQQALAYSDIKDELYFNIALACQNRLDYESAVKFLKKCILENPDFEMAYEELAVSYGFSGLTDDGVVFYKQLIDRIPYSYLAWFNLGDVYSRLGQYDNALEAFDYALLIKDDYVPALIEQGNTFALMDRYDEAIASFKSTFNYSTPDAVIFYNIAECYENLEKMEEARGYYKKAVKLNPEMSQAWYGIGTTLEFQQKWFEAIHYIKKALEFDATNGEYWYTLGDCECELNNLEEAEKCYIKVMEHEPENPEIWFTYADFLVDSVRTDEAVELIAIGVKNHPDNIEMYLRLVSYLFMNGESKEGLHFMETALDKNFEAFPLLFELNPTLENNQDILQLIELKRKK
jgi:tetratricopeptide (TPR) repeat protein